MTLAKDGSVKLITANVIYSTIHGEAMKDEIKLYFIKSFVFIVTEANATQVLYKLCLICKFLEPRDPVYTFEHPIWFLLSLVFSPTRQNTLSYDLAVVFLQVEIPATH